MKQNIEVEILGKPVVVEAVVVDEAYAVFNHQDFVCLAQKMVDWELEVVLHKSYAPQVIGAFVSFLDYEETHKTGLFPTA